jgi:hypothetical protein
VVAVGQALPELRFVVTPLQVLVAVALLQALQALL